MRDGLYYVTTSYLCAGFVVEHGEVTQIAPILKERFDYWKTLAEFIPMKKRPYQYLPLPEPKDYDPGPLFFYENIVHPMIPDAIRIMDTGLYIDQDAVESLRVVIDEVLQKVEKTLARNPYIRKFQEHIQPKLQEAWEEQATKAVRTADAYLREYNPNDIQHRTWVVNQILSDVGKKEDHKDKWAVADIKKYNIFAALPLLDMVVQKQISPQSVVAQKAMQALAEYKTELWNKPRWEKARQRVEVPPFNPNSNPQVRDFFDFLGIEALAWSKDTGEPSWGRDQLEELQRQTADEKLLEVLQAMIDFSYSAIIRNNFLKAFDSFTIEGVLHGKLKLFGAKSFRPTSNSPNLLNMPSTKSIYAKPLKRCFIAPEGFVVYAIDLSALEDRVMANLSYDENKLALFKDSLDGHSMSATYYFKDRVIEILNQPFEDHKEASKLLKKLVDTGHKGAIQVRQDSKPVSFGLAYGAYPPKVAATIKCPLAEAERIFNAYHHELFPGVTDYRENYALRTAEEQGYLHLGLGCRLYTDDPAGDIRTLANGTIQFWSILTLIAINEFNYQKSQNPEVNAEVCSTIYDSVYLYVEKDAEQIKWVNDTLVPLLCTDYIEDQQIPNEAEGEIGYNWADTKAIPNNASLEEIQKIIDSLDEDVA